MQAIERVAELTPGSRPARHSDARAAAASKWPPRSGGRGPAIIFCTAYDQYAVDAFELHAVDYLLKPVNRARLHAAIERVAPSCVSVDREHQLDHVTRGREHCAGTLSRAQGRALPRRAAAGGRRLHLPRRSDPSAYRHRAAVDAADAGRARPPARWRHFLPGLTHGHRQPRRDPRSEAVSRRHGRSDADQWPDAAGDAPALAAADGAARAIGRPSALTVNPRTCLSLVVISWRCSRGPGRPARCAARAAWTASARPGRASHRSRLAKKSCSFARCGHPTTKRRSALLDSWITPVEHFYVRSHMPMPPASTPRPGRCRSRAKSTRRRRSRLDELRKMPSATSRPSLECAGNGRAFFDPPVAGIQWGEGRGRQRAMDGRAHGRRAEARRRRSRPAASS